MSTQHLKRYPKGVTGNPGGQTKAQALARRLAADFIREQTDGGRDILRFMVGVLRSENVEIQGRQVTVPDDAKSRCWAAETLADRLWGKSTILVEATEPAEEVALPDVRGMTIEELRAAVAAGAAPTSEADDEPPPGPLH